MKFFAVLLMASAASAGMVPAYSSSDFDGSSGGASSGGGVSAGSVSMSSSASAADSMGRAAAGYGGGSTGYGTQKKCTPYFESASRDHCESYNERVCTTTQKEACTDVNDQNCRGVVSSKQERKCFDVTELRCSLKEDVQVETIQVPVTIQKCHKATERVCDTVYESSSTHKDKFQCITVNKPTCTSSEQTLFDRTCRTTTSFDCETTDVDYPAPGPSAYGGEAASGYGSEPGYGGEVAASAAASGYGGEYSTTTGYGEPQVNCRRTQDTKCYKTPRTVNTQQCSARQEKVCEKMSELTPSVQPRQSCHNEEKKMCDLVERTQPKQVKKYVYTKQCRSVPRQVCENADRKTLVPSCVPTTRKECSYSPVEQCQDEPKQHCFKVNYKIKKQRCEQVQVGYPTAPTSEY